ncbi:hypothetical protein BT63DRAFT_411655 [Microthyrium microscopicum]|uniref:Uncharacterized protein n=1 Tax=Microthyrium microscopicum TaxID=703497 RepID=A0A6A6UKS3_9PEZI|nr:hypothetical protein BT63DRAFT_411655 [Microthyrium microscopicum]
MKPTTIALSLTAILPLANAGVITKRGGPIFCTIDPGGLKDYIMTNKADRDYQSTKDCCAAVRHTAFFNEDSHKCQGPFGGVDNAVNWGGMVKCCTSRGMGSHGDKLIGKADPQQEAMWAEEKEGHDREEQWDREQQHGKHDKHDKNGDGKKGKVLLNRSASNDALTFHISSDIPGSFLLI